MFLKGQFFKRLIFFGSWICPPKGAGFLEGAFGIKGFMGNFFFFYRTNGFTLRPILKKKKGGREDFGGGIVGGQLKEKQFFPQGGFRDFLLRG